MKKLILMFGICIAAVAANAQDIPASQVPSVILNVFKQHFPQATDIEWELKGELYEVDFEIANADQEVWFDKNGKIVKHKQDIKENELPTGVASSIKRDFNGYRLSDIEKITAEDKVTFTMELKKVSEEWKVVYDDNGKLLSKVPD